MKKQFTNYLLVLFFITLSNANAQTTITTPYTGSFTSFAAPAQIAFVLENTNPTAIILTNVDQYCQTTENNSIWQLYYSATSLSGVGSPVPGPLWTLIATSPPTPVAANGIVPVFSGLSFNIPTGTQYRFVMKNTGPGMTRYVLTPTPNLTLFSGGGVNLKVGTTQIAGANVGYSGNGTTLATTPRYWHGAVTFSPAIVCTNPPTPGTVTTSGPNPTCAGVPFILSLTGGTAGSGQTYQWQSSPNDLPPWTNLGTSATQPIASQTSNTYYRCEVTCGVTVTSASLPVLMGNIDACYCAPTYVDGCGAGQDAVVNVFIPGQLNNTSGCTPPPNYTYYSAVPAAILNRGGTYSISITMAHDATGQFATAWIDYDRDGLLSAGENLGISTDAGPNGTAVLNFTVPAGGYTGTTRLRVRGGDDVAMTAGQACGATNSTWGESEDYNVILQNPVACSGTPVAGTTVAAPTTVCAGANFLLDLTGATTETGITYQWQSGPTSLGPFLDIGGATNSTLITSQATTTWYQCVLTCTNGGATAASVPAEVQTTPALAGGTYTINNTLPTGGLNFISFIDAFNALGCTSPAGNVVFNVSAGQVFNEPALVLESSGLVSATITFQKSGGGANPIVRRASANPGLINTTGTGSPGDVVIIINKGDYITFDAIDIQENPAFADNTTKMEYGYGLTRTSTDACKNVTITNCNVSLDKSNFFTTGIYSSNFTSLGAGVTATSTGGRAENINITNNVLSNVYFGITQIGYNHTVSPNDLYDQGMNISGNTITGFGNTAGPHFAYGIYTQYANNVTASSNILSGGAGTVASVYGIISQTTINANVTFNSNTISVTGGGTTQACYGIFNSAGATGTSNTITINNNTIQNCTYPTSTTGTLTCIHQAGAGTNVNINGNIILDNTRAATSGSIFGIVNTVGGTITISQNKIDNLSTTGTGSTTASGIQAGGGTTTTLTNNLIGNLTTPNSTNATGIVGIHVSAGTTVNVFYNTVYLNATSTSVTTFGSSAINITSTTPVTELRNNIFVNTSTPVGTSHTVALRRSGTALTGYSANSNNNLLYAGTPGANRLIYFDGTNQDQTLAAYKIRVAPRDNAAVTENPPFLSTTGSSVDFLHIDPAIGTQVESGGSTVAGITTDYDNQTRNATTPDIGADEGAFTLADLSGPVISYTALPNTACPNNPVISATIVDPSGVEINPTIAPRVYYKKSTNANVIPATNDNTTDGWKYMETASVSSPFSFTIDYSLLFGGATPPLTIQYFVVAQDAQPTPVVGLFAGTFASTPSSVNLNTVELPTGFLSYNLAPSLAGGTVSIAGGGATYPTLTGTGGLFEAINNAGLNGNLIAEITSGAYIEPGTVALNAITYGCAASYTLTIKPAASMNPTVIGSGLNFIKLNGADNVIIDGSNNGSNSRDLTLSSASGTTNANVIWLSSLGAGLGSTNNIVKNCNVIGGADQSTGTVVTFGIISCGTTISLTGNGLDNNNNTFDNNAITKVRYGIWLRGDPTTTNQNNVISNNLVGPTSFGSDQIGKVGICIQTQNNAMVTGNEVRYVGGTFSTTTSGIDRFGISVGGSDSWTPTLNLVTNSTISKNVIHHVSEGRTFSAIGISVASTATAATNNLIANNFIYDIVSNGTASDYAAGIGIAGGNGDKIVFNSIRLSGDADPAGSSNATVGSAGIRITSTTPVNLTFKNNIISVDFTSNTTSLKHFGIVVPSNTYSWGTGGSSNNDIYVNPANTQMVFGGLGTTAVPGTLVPDLATWQTTFTPNQEVNSASAQPVFLSSTDLHLSTSANGYMESGGTPIAGVTDDIDAQVRHATTPDMGADEFAGCRLSVTAGSNSPVCENTNLNLTTTTALGSGSFTYLWSGPDSFTSTNQNPVITGVSTLAAGTYTVTVTDVTLGCTISSTVTVTVNAAPVPIAGSNSPVCVGGDIQLSGGPSGMTTYAWSGPNAFASSVQNPPVISNASALHDGTYTLTVTNSLTCSATTTTDVDVVPNPVPSIASQTNVSCNGLSDGAVDIDATSGTPPYTFSDGFSPNTDGIFTGLAAGPYTITVTDDPGCSATIPVTITEPAVLDVTAGSNSPICSTSPLNLTSNPTGGTTAYSFAWSGPAGFSSTNEDPTIASPTSANSGTYTVTVTDANSCVTTTTTSVSVSDQPTTALAGPDQTVFVNSAGLAANAALSGTGTWTVITGTGTFSPNANNENATVSGLTPGLNTFRWTISNPPCTDSFDEVDITYQNCTPPTATISGNSSVCLGSSANVVLTFTGVAPWTYTISGSGGPYTATTSNNPENVSVTPTVSGSQAYTVTAISNTNCGSGTASGSATVLVSTAPPANTVSNVGGTTGACNGDVVLMTSNVITGQNIKYSWNTGSNSSVVKFSTNIGGPFVNGPFETTANSVYAQFGALAGGSSGYNICVQGTNGCGSTNNKCTWIRGIVSPPAAITGSAIQCSGATGQAYSSAAVPSATIYTWSFSVPGAVFAGQGTQNVSVDFPAFSSGNLCVTAALSCGGSSTSAPKCMAISNATANPGVMTGPNKICPGQTGVVYSIPAIAGAGTYNWTVPAGATITANTGPSITVSWPNPYTLNQSVCVTATSVCGAISAARCKSVSSGIPSTPGTISGQAAGVCGQTIVYSVVPVAGGTSYTWVVPAGGTINSGQGTNSINVTWGLVTTLQISVTANSACGSSGPRTLNIAGAPATPGAISQLPAVVCNGGPANFSITAVAGATGYTWTVPANGSVIDNGQGTTSIDVTWGTGTGTVTVKANNACGVSPSTSNKLVTPGCKMASGSVSVMGTEMNLAAYPNPAHDKLVLEVSSDKNTGCTIKMIDIAGRVVIQKEYKLAKGINAHEIDVSNLPAGIYLLELVNEQRNERIKVVKE